MPEYSAWFKAVTWLFFYTPHLYAERLYLIYLDKKVNYQVWRKFIAELREDWENSITPVRAYPNCYSDHAADRMY